MIKKPLRSCHFRQQMAIFVTFEYLTLLKSCRNNTFLNSLPCPQKLVIYLFLDLKNKEVSNLNVSSDVLDYRCR